MPAAGNHEWDQIDTLPAQQTRIPIYCENHRPVACSFCCAWCCFDSFIRMHSWFNWIVSS